MKFNKSKHAIVGVFGEGDEPTIEQKIISKLGIEPEAIAKIKSGELDLDSYAESYFSNYESNLKSRLLPDLEKQAMSEAFGKAYGKAEKTVLDVFGLESDKYAEIDKKERFSTIVSDVKRLHQEKLNGFESADAQKLSQLTSQLEQANKLIRQKEIDAQTQLEQLRSEYKAKEDSAKVFKKQSDLISGVENARLTPKEMQLIVRGEMLEKGFATEIDADGRIWITKNGNLVKHPTKPTENLTFESFFGLVASDYDFKKKSNAGSNSGDTRLDLKENPNYKNLPPQFVKHMQENGLM